MQIETEENGADTVLKVSGRLDTLNAKPFEGKLLEAVKASNGMLIVDLTGVDYVSSSGLRALLVAGKAMAPHKRKLRLKSLQPQIQEVFDISGFSALFEIH